MQIPKRNNVGIFDDSQFIVPFREKRKIIPFMGSLKIIFENNIFSPMFQYFIFIFLFALSIELNIIITIANNK